MGRVEEVMRDVVPWRTLWEGGAVEWQRVKFGKCVETQITDKREREREDLGQA